MDIIVTTRKSGRAWGLADLLGRSMGRVTHSADNGYLIQPAGQALETMDGMRLGPHASLDAALAEIERHTRGTCRRKPGQDQPA